MTTKVQRITGVTRTIVRELDYPQGMFETVVYPTTNTGSRPLNLVFQMPTWDNGAPKIEWITCPFCNREHAKAAMTWVGSDNIFVCSECYKDRFVCCDYCGVTTMYLRPVNMRNTGTRTRGLVCKRCLSQYYIRCDGCGTLVDSHDYESTNNQSLCRPCDAKFRQENHYCRHCSKWVPTAQTMTLSGGDKVCVACYIAANAPVRPIKEILDYCKTRGEAFFSTEGGSISFFGYEWEGQNGKSPSQQNRKFLEELWHFHECKRKKDGSIPYGHEIATLPLTVEYHRKFFGWDRIMKLHIDEGFKAHEDPSSGGHTHISKATFGSRNPKQKRSLAAYTYLFQRPDWRAQWKKFSRRGNKYMREALTNGTFHGSDLYGYSKFFQEDYSTHDIIAGYDACHDENRRDRNMILNFWTYDTTGGHVVNKDTVELRLCKSTTEYKTILATIEMCDVVAKIATKKWTEAGLRAMTWRHLCKKIPNDYHELVGYLRTMRLWEV